MRNYVRCCLSADGRSWYRALALMLVLMYAAPVVALQVFYTAEGDSISAVDRLTDDGFQNGTFTQTWSNNVNPSFLSSLVSC